VIYSVLNPRNREYDYFETGEVEPWHAPAPPLPSSASALGATPEQIAWPLPRGARPIGSGPEARGRIATRAAARTSTPLGLGAIEPALGAAAAVALMIGGVALMTRMGR